MTPGQFYTEFTTKVTGRFASGNVDFSPICFAILNTKYLKGGSPKRVSISSTDCDWPVSSMWSYETTFLLEVNASYTIAVRDLWVRRILLASPFGTLLRCTPAISLTRSETRGNYTFNSRQMQLPAIAWPTMRPWYEFGHKDYITHESW